MLWDLDGVLVDSEPLLFLAERALFAEHGVDLTPELKRPFVGLGGHEVLAAMAEAFEVEADLDAWSTRKAALYLALLGQVESFAQTGALARALHADGVPMAVASGSSLAMIDAALRAAGLSEVLPTRASVAEVARGKPAPDVFLLAAERLGMPPSRCVVIEDAMPGLLAAHAAGMRCVAIPSLTGPPDPRFEEADLLVRGGMAAADPEELKAWILMP